MIPLYLVTGSVTSQIEVAWTYTILGGWLSDHQCGRYPQEQPVKKESICDLLTIMSDKVVVKFKVGPDSYEIETGSGATFPGH